MSTGIVKGDVRPDRSVLAALEQWHSPSDARRIVDAELDRLGTTHLTRSDGAYHKLHEMFVGARAAEALAVDGICLASSDPPDLLFKIGGHVIGVVLWNDCLYQPVPSAPKRQVPGAQ
jgi:hypothetical protein